MANELSGCSANAGKLRMRHNEYWWIMNKQMNRLTPVLVGTFPSLNLRVKPNKIKSLRCERVGRFQARLSAPELRCSVAERIKHTAYTQRKSQWKSYWLFTDRGVWTLAVDEWKAQETLRKETTGCMLRYSIHFSYGCHLTNREVFICLMTTKATGEKKAQIL